jgi:uncharacterized membrane protein
MTPGALICLASAVAFGAMGIFGKLAYGEGATVGTLLAVRFVLAAALFWVLVAATGALREVRRLRRADVGAALALGAVGYSLQAGAYFTALRRLDASLLSLLLYTFPAMVTVAEIALGRERASARTGGALALASAGLALVLAGAGTGALDPLGAVLGLGAALVYTTYILSSARVAERVGPLVLSALVAVVAARPRDRRGLRLARRHRRRLDRRRREPVLRRPAARGPDARVDPLDGRAADRRRPRVRRVRRDDERLAARGRRARPRRGGRAERAGRAPP